MTVSIPAEDTFIINKTRHAIKALGAVWNREARSWDVPDDQADVIRKMIAESPMKAHGRKSKSKSKSAMPPVIVEALAAVRAAVHVLDALESALLDKRIAIVMPMLSSRSTLDGPIEADDLVFAGLECTPSPIGTCVFNEKVDFSHDDCLFCHQPRDRG